MIGFRSYITGKYHCPLYCAKQTGLCWQNVVDNFNLKDYKLCFFQDSEREHIDVFDVFCGEAVVQNSTLSSWNRIELGK